MHVSTTCHPKDIIRLMLISLRPSCGRRFFLRPSLTFKIYPFNFTSVSVVATVLAIIVLMCTKYFRLVKKSVERNAARFLYSGGELKQVYMVRSDLDMGKGKIAAQCCHAAVKAYRGMIDNLDGARKLLDRWENQGSRKVVLKVSSEEELVDIISKAKAKGLYATTIRDAGLTQIASGSMTVGVIGPATDTIIDEVSGHLKLL